MHLQNLCEISHRFILNQLLSLGSGKTNVAVLKIGCNVPPGGEGARVLPFLKLAKSLTCRPKESLSSAHG